jgi:hypothetical protein
MVNGTLQKAANRWFRPGFLPKFLFLVWLRRHTRALRQWEKKQPEGSILVSKKFKLPGNLPPLVRLKIFKSMFGTKVFLNGKEVGESELCFTPLYFNITPFLKATMERMN